MYDRMHDLIDSMTRHIYEREEAVRLGLLASIAGESLFLLGPPGTGKSLIARRLQQAFAGARSFSYLMGRFSTPDEVFGPLSIRALREEDRYERTVANYLPDADVVFLDEIWKASPPIQNALLTALNERIYRNGSVEIPLPLKAFIGASNELPEDADDSAAFWDRFLVRVVVEPIRAGDPFVALLRDAEDPYAVSIADDLKITRDEYERVQEMATAVEIPDEVIHMIEAIRTRLGVGDENAAPVYVSDRRWKKIARLLRVCALLHDRGVVEPVDCALLRACTWSRLEEQEYVARVVTEELTARAGDRQASARAAARLEELRGEIDALTRYVVAREVPKPRRYRQEYYRLVAGDVEDVGEPASDAIVLAWHGDVDELRIGETSDIDLFFYDDSEQLTGSAESRVTRVDETTLEVDGVRYGIEVTIQRVESEEIRTPGSEDLARLSTRVGALLGDIDSDLDRLLDTQFVLEDGARAHLFVAQEDVDVVIASLRETATRLSEIRLLVGDLAPGLAGPSPGLAKP